MSFYFVFVYWRVQAKTSMGKAKNVAKKTWVPYMYNIVALGVPVFL